MTNMVEETSACVALLKADGQEIERIINTFNDGEGRYTNDILGFAIMGLAVNIQRIDNELRKLRQQSNALDSSCY